MYSTPEPTPSQDIVSVGVHEAANRGAPQGDAALPGLSSVHTGPENIRTVFDAEPELVLWRGASLVSVQGEGGLAGPGGKRKEITSFSRASRRRFMRSIGRISLDAELPLFFTCTYPDVFEESPERWKRDLKVFSQRIKRAYPSAGFYWRIEMKARESGTNLGQPAPHFHALVWGIPWPRGKGAKAARKELYRWFALNWWEVVGSEDPDHLAAGTRVEKVRSWRGVWFYCSKYLAKVDQVDLGKKYEGIGRWWGIVNEGNIPLGDEMHIPLTPGEAVKIGRLMRRKLRRSGPVRSVLSGADFWLQKVLPWAKGAEPPSGYAEHCAYADDFQAHVRAGHVWQELANPLGWYSFIPYTEGGEGVGGSG